jgi:hypothetical protein
VQAPRRNIELKATDPDPSGSLEICRARVCQFLCVNVFCLSLCGCVYCVVVSLSP